jgi:hypothetical protein
MTTHELANLLDHLKMGLGTSFKAEGGKAFDEASAAFRELPDQPLKKLAEQLRSIAAPAANGRRKSAAVNVAELIEQIRGVQNGSPATDELKSRLGALTNTHFREILTAFHQKPTTRTDGNRSRVMDLLAPQTNGPPASDGAPTDPQAIETGVKLYMKLRDTRSMPVAEVRAAFEPLRAYSKPVLEEISRRVGYTPIGSREDILNRLLSNLEGIKMNQQRVDSILN